MSQLRAVHLAALALAALALALSVGLALGAPAELDTSFDGDGKRTIDYGGADSGQAVALQPDGKILVAGYGGSNTAMTVTRLNPDGSLDNSFDGDGTAGVDQDGDERAYALALQPDGKIVLVGETSPLIGFGPDIAVARLNSDGSPDAGFNGTGVRLIDYGLSFDQGRAVALQPDGKILVAGYGGPDTAMMVTRLNPDGSNDTSFGMGGTSSVDLGVIERAHAVALVPDGKIVVVGERSATTGPSSGVNVVVARLGPGGAIDRDFGSNGTRIIDYAGGADSGQAVTLQPDGKIVVAGFLTGLGGRDVAVTRLNPDGSNDISFGNGGSTDLDFGATDDANAVALQPNGKIVVAGRTGGGVALPGTSQSAASSRAARPTPPSTSTDGARSTSAATTPASGLRSSRTGGSSSPARPTPTSRSRASRATRRRLEGVPAPDPVPSGRSAAGRCHGVPGSGRRSSAPRGATSCAALRAPT